MPTLSARQPLDIDFVRTFFPGLRDGLAFFENGGGSYACQPVIDRISRYLTEDMVQLGGDFDRSRRATNAVDEGFAAAARLVDAQQVGEVILGASTTMNAYVLAKSLAPLFAADDEVVVTNLDHEANVGAWYRLRETGVRVREWEVDPDSHQLTLEGLEAALSDRTRLVCFTHCSNVVGTVHHAKTFVDRIHQAGAWACVDGVAFSPHRRVDVGALGADFYLLSLYKVFGPHMGLLFVRKDVLHEVESQNHFFLTKDPPSKLMPGYVSHELAAGVAGVLEYLDLVDRHHGGDPADGGSLDRVFELFGHHEEALAERLLSFLRDHPKVRIIGNPSSDRAARVPTVSFTVEGRACAEIPPALGERGVAVRHGNFYARRAMRAFGLDPEDGLIRISAAHYNRLEEVDRVVEALDAVL